MQVGIHSGPLEIELSNKKRRSNNAAAASLSATWLSGTRGRRSELVGSSGWRERAAPCDLPGRFLIVKSMCFRSPSCTPSHGRAGCGIPEPLFFTCLDLPDSWGSTRMEGVAFEQPPRKKIIREEKTQQRCLPLSRSERRNSYFFHSTMPTTISTTLPAPWVTKVAASRRFR